jgi:hypothetical protein
VSSHWLKYCTRSLPEISPDPLVKQFYFHTICFHTLSRFIFHNTYLVWLACCLLHVRFLLGLLYHPGDGGDMFLRNVGWLSLDYTSLYPKIQKSSYFHAYEVTTDWVWIGNLIYWPLSDRNYINYSSIANAHTLNFTTARNKSSQSAVSSVVAW